MGEMSLDQFAKDMRRGASKFNKEIRTDLSVAGEIVASSARAMAGSSKIAGSIKHARRGYNVVIEAGGKDVPEAALRERGNVKSSPTATTFRHPVYGNRENWVTQKKHPFLLPAFVANRRKVLDLMRKAMHDSFPGNV